MTDAEWFRITTAAQAQFERMLEHAERMEPPFSGPRWTDRQREFLVRAEVSYARTILEAWAKYEPTLTKPYDVPEEVVRLRRWVER